MPFEFSVSFDPKPIESELMERFGEGSRAQYEWSRIVFDGSRKYMPKVTGTFENLSYIHSEPLFDKGELLYTSGGSGGANYAHYLWEGILYVDPDYGKGAFYDPYYGFWSRPGVTKVPTDTPLDFNKEANPNAGPRWVERAAADEYPQWVSEMQELKDRGIV